MPGQLPWSSWNPAGASVLAVACAAVGLALALPTPRSRAAHPRADLVVVRTAVQTPRARPGSRLRVVVVVRNRGRRPVRAFTLRPSLVPVQGEGRRVGLRSARRVRLLRAGRSVRVRLRVRVPAGMRPGGYRVLTCVRAAGGARERSTRNTCRAARGRVTLLQPRVVGRTPPREPGTPGDGPGGPRPACGPYPSAQPEADVQLAAWLDANVLEHRFPQRDSGQYRVVAAGAEGDAIRAALARAVGELQRGDLAAASAALALLPAPPLYRVACLRGDHDRPLLVMWEPRTSGPSRGWPVLVWSPWSRHDVLVEAPHPKADLHTEDLAVQAFLRADARGLLIAGAHRYALGKPSETPPPWGPADVAHDEGSPFEAMHRQALTGLVGGAVVQLHGFAASLHPTVTAKVVVSSAGRAPFGAADAVRAALAAARVPATDQAAGLEGTKNVQAASTAAAGRQFVHVEVESALRGGEGQPNEAGITRVAAAVAEGLQACEAAATC